ncbi:MAG: major capsid protein [Paraclostridium sp.]
MPSYNQIHIDRALTNVSVAYMQDADAFIADKVFPMVPVLKQSDTFFIYRKEDFFTDEAQERATGTESAGGNYNIDQFPPYFCKVYSFHKDVDDRERTNQDDPLNCDRDATEFVSHKLMLKRDILWADTFFRKTVWGTDLTFGATTPMKVNSSSGALEQGIYWDKPISTPIKDIAMMRTFMLQNTGYKLNRAVLTPYVYDALMNHEDILDRIKYTQKGIVGKDLLAELFELDEIVIPYAIKNTQAMGKDGKYNFILGQASALFVHTPSSPGLKKPSAGYIFTWTGLKGAGAYGNNMIRIPMPWLGMDTERIEGSMAFDMKVVCKDLGIFIEKAIDLPTA